MDLHPTLNWLRCVRVGNRLRLWFVQHRYPRAGAGLRDRNTRELLTSAWQDRKMANWWRGRSNWVRSCSGRLVKTSSGFRFSRGRDCRTAGMDDSGKPAKASGWSAAPVAVQTVMTLSRGRRLLPRMRAACRGDARAASSSSERLVDWLRTATPGTLRYPAMTGVAAVRLIVEMVGVALRRM